METKNKLIIESDIIRTLSIIDLAKLEKNDMNNIELLFVRIISKFFCLF